MQTGNSYYVCLGREVIDWDINNSDKKINLHTVYFQKTFLAMEEALESEGWTIYLTWNIERLPTYGPKVVAVILGDELAQMPTYKDRVGMVFKCYGVGPPLGCSPLRNPSYQNLLTLLQHGYARARYYLSVFKQKRSNKRIPKNELWKTPVHPIPLGYANQVQVPFIPFDEREADVSFAGSVVHRQYKWWSLQKWCKTPKSYSRAKMIAYLHRYIDKYPSARVDLKITPSFKAIRSADPVSYSDRVMSTKISLVPRGASYETYRFFEAIRFGCIVIGEYLPDFEFYKGAPIIRISDWRNLESELNALLENPELARERHQEMMDWWETKCSEKAIGTFMADQLNEVFNERISHLLLDTASKSS